MSRLFFATYRLLIYKNLYLVYVFTFYPFQMKQNHSFLKLLFFLLVIFCCKSLTAQQSLLVNLGSNTCAAPLSPSFSIIREPLSTPSIITDCSLYGRIPDYYFTFIAYNPSNNKIYVNDVRYITGSRIWILDMGLPDSIQCPAYIPVDPEYAPEYSTNNFEFDNTGKLWSLRNYNPETGTCNIDQYDILTGNILATKTLRFPAGNFPTDIGSGDLCILPNGRLFATFGSNPSRLYEITNYNDGIGDASAAFLQNMPRNTFGIAYLNGQLEITGTNSFDSCYYFDYDISSNTLGASKNFQNGYSPIDNTSISPIIGATKKLLSATKINSNTANLTYEIYVQNIGNIILNNVNLTEDLGKVFGPANISNVTVQFSDGYNVPSLTLNPAYNGTTVTNLLNDGQQLKNHTSDTANYLFKLDISFTVTNLNLNDIYYNSAITTANIGSGDNLIPVSDSSNNGGPEMTDPNNNGIANEYGENIPTPFKLLDITPVRFISASASLLSPTASLIKWNIAIPQNNISKFTVEYSIDCIHWKQAGNVAPGSPMQGSYSFTHENIPAETLYYRIRETDIGGTSILSNIILLKNNLSDHTIFNIYPNPASDKIFISSAGQAGNNDKTTYELFEITGRRLYLLQSTESDVNIDTHTFPQGSYFLKISNSENTRSYKLLITHH